MSEPTEDDTDPIKFIAENPKTHVAVNAVRFLAQIEQQTPRKIYGQIQIEAQFPLPCCFGIFPGGDFYCWFVEAQHFFVVLLVNENGEETVKTVAVFAPHESEQLGGFLSSLINQLNIKHGYPIESPNSFVPAETGTNRANQDNHLE